MKKILSLLLALAMLFALCACGSEKAQEAPAEEPTAAETAETVVQEAAPVEQATTTLATKKTADDTLVYAMAFSGAAFDPCNTVSDWTTTILMTYETLVVYNNETGELEGRLADEWEVVDAQTLTFHLREGVTFSNGDPLTGEDVLFSWQRCLSSVIHSGNAGYIDWDNCVVDGQNLTVKLLEPNAEFIYVLCGIGFSVVSKAYVEQVGEDAFKLEPCGTGPYVLSDFVQGERITYTRNENYWGGTPKYATVEIRPVMEEATRSIAFEAGEYDIARISTSDSIASLSGREGEGIYVAPTEGSTLYYLNLWDQSEVFSVKENRLAVAHAIDWEALAASIWGDYAMPGYSALSTASGDYKNVGVYEYDPELAKQYLAEAGNPDGFAIGIAVSTSGDDLAICEILQAYLAEVGITLTIDTMDNQLARQASADGSHEVSIGQNTAVVPALSMIWSGQLAGSNSLLQEVHTDFEAGAQFQELFTQIMQETDAAAKTALVEQIQQLVRDEALWLPISQVDNVFVYYDYLENAAQLVNHAGFSAGLDLRDLYL